MLHDRKEHQRRRWLTYRMRKALGDLFLGPSAILKVGILRLFMGCLGFLRVQAGLSMS